MWEPEEEDDSGWGSFVAAAPAPGEAGAHVWVPAGVRPRGPVLPAQVPDVGLRRVFAPAPVPAFAAAASSSQEDDFDEGESFDSFDDEEQQLLAELLALPAASHGEIAALLPVWESPAPARCPAEGYTPYQVW